MVNLFTNFGGTGDVWIISPRLMTNNQPWHSRRAIDRRNMAFGLGQPEADVLKACSNQNVANPHNINQKTVKKTNWDMCLTIRTWRILPTTGSPSVKVYLRSWTSSYFIIISSQFQLANMIAKPLKSKKAKQTEGSGPIIGQRRPMIICKSAMGVLSRWFNGTRSQRPFHRSLWKPRKKQKPRK